jgi:hypothetical protein
MELQVTGISREIANLEDLQGPFAQIERLHFAAILLATGEKLAGNVRTDQR